MTTSLNDASSDSAIALGHAAFDRLCLDSADLAAVAQNGFVARESRTGTAARYKLRYRVDGRQRVRVLGRDPEVAAVVLRAVDDLQRDKRLNQELRKLCQAARAKLRDGKRQLAPLLAAQGIVFHGYALAEGAFDNHVCHSTYVSAVVAKYVMIMVIKTSNPEKILCEVVLLAEIEVQSRVVPSTKRKRGRQ